MTTPVVSVIIVNYNGGPLLTECVRSALLSTYPVEVIVSDNGSTDGSTEKIDNIAFPEKRLTVIENGANLGFAKANNIAVKSACGELFLFLNPDCVIRPDTVEKMVAVLGDHEKVGMAGCLIRNRDGSEQAGCRRNTPTPMRTVASLTGLNRLFPESKKFESFVLTGTPLPEGPTQVEAISGAFMLVPKRAFDDVGPLDETYFMHCEDLDWCFRFRQAGWHVLFVPGVEVIHEKGTPSKGRPYFVEWHKHRGMVIYFQKFFRDEYPYLYPLIVLAVWLKFGVVVAKIFIRRMLG